MQMHPTTFAPCRSTPHGRSRSLPDDMLVRTRSLSDDRSLRDWKTRCIKIAVCFCTKYSCVLDFRRRLRGIRATQHRHSLDLQVGLLAMNLQGRRQGFLRLRSGSCFRAVRSQGGREARHSICHRYPLRHSGNPAFRRFAMFGSSQGIEPLASQRNAQGSFAGGVEVSCRSGPTYSPNLVLRWTVRT